MKIDRPGIYVHIPFCLRKCPYCDFVSYPVAKVDGNAGVNTYIDALIQEIGARRRWLETEGLFPDAFHSLYIGGGTPSLLTAKQLTMLVEVIKSSFPFTREAEVTLEVNPGTITQSEVVAWRELGINRLSLGVQSFDDHMLAYLGRVHAVRDVYQTVKALRSAGFTNLSFDLMFGLPGQNLGQWQDSLRQAAHLEPPHISCYELTIEPGTAYAILYEEGKLEVPSEEEAIAMLEWTDQYLTGLGYDHYEISNYALPRFKSRHNQIYWQNRWYLGLGVAAYSYWGGRRWGNTTSLVEYSQSLAAGRLPEATTETLDLVGQVGETIMLGLRLAEGVSLAELRARFGISAWEIWEPEIQRLLRQGLVELAQGCLRLTAQGLLLANRVQSAFLRSS
ncbi:MAG: radical SAM family heme chaperone HemW [Firmicutes bacterium]|nr:radical SAM family heme chaperone HemW [Bacillota bacterium]